MGNKPFVLLFSRCETCGKMVRYSESAFKNHAALHQTGKLSCELCQGMDQGADKRFTKESLAAHNRRMHTKGAFPCKVEGEQMVNKCFIKSLDPIVLKYDTVPELYVCFMID